MAKALTVKALESVKAGPARREIPDGGLPGLYFIVQPSGARSWAVRYRHGGKPKKLTIGPYPAFGLMDARQAGSAALRAASEGKDPAAAKKADKAAAVARVDDTVDLVETVFAEFMKRHVLAKNKSSSARESARIIEREIGGAWRGRRIREIGRRDVIALLDSIVDRGAPYQANRVHALLRKAFNWFSARGIVDATPVANIASPAAEVSRDRVLSDDEIRAVWLGADTIGWPFGPLARLLLLTGQRREEVAGAEWSELDLDAPEPIWTIPKERIKNKTAHTVPLSPAAVTIFKSLPKVTGTDGAARLVFTTTGKTPVSGFSRGKISLDAAALAVARSEAVGRGADPSKVTIPDWRFHDLRRTAASGMAGMGIPPHVVEKVLNHRSGTIRGVAAVYNRHDYAADRRRALEAWADEVAAIVDPNRADNVVLLRAAK